MSFPKKIYGSTPRKEEEFYGTCRLWPSTSIITECFGKNHQHVSSQNPRRCLNFITLERKGKKKTYISSRIAITLMHFMCYNDIQGPNDPHSKETTKKMEKARVIRVEGRNSWYRSPLWRVLTSAATFILHRICHISFTPYMCHNHICSNLLPSPAKWSLPEKR